MPHGLLLFFRFLMFFSPLALLFMRNMPLAVAPQDPSTEIALLGARQCSCAGSCKSILVSPRHP